VTAAANSKTYDGTTSAAAIPTITSGSVQTGDTANFTEAYATKNAGTGETLTLAGSVNDGNGGNNYSDTFVSSANGTINPATLTYTANSASMAFGAAVPVLGGTVTGFVGTDTQANATTGTLIFTTTATSASAVGSYPITGSGLTANNGDYTFVQAAANVTALRVTATVSANFSSASLSGNQLQMVLSAGAGQQFALDRSINLSTWTALVTNTVPAGGTLNFTDTPSTNNSKSIFYRARLVP